MNKQRKEILGFAAAHLVKALALIDRAVAEETAAYNATPKSLQSDDVADTIDAIQTLRDALQSAIDGAADILPPVSA